MRTELGLPPRLSGPCQSSLLGSNSSSPTGSSPGMDKLRRSQLKTSQKRGFSEQSPNAFTMETRAGAGIAAGIRPWLQLGRSPDRERFQCQPRRLGKSSRILGIIPQEFTPFPAAEPEAAPDPCSPRGAGKGREKQKGEGEAQ